MTKRKSDFTLPTLDDLFTTQAERDDAKLERVKNIPLDELHPFKNHPFKVQNNEEMERMIESIRKVGTITPALARPLPDGGYELISGHRRLAACQVLGIETMPVIVREMSDDEAVIAMVDANLQRETILPSEKAFAYKMKLDAIKHQGVTSRQLGEKLLSIPVLVAAFYGLRRGEVCGLKWDAIDFERGTITIRHTVTSLQVDGKTKMYAQDSAKTKSSMRTLPLVGSFAEYFKEAKAAQEVNKKVCGNCYNYEYDGYVFVDELGDLMRPEYLTSYFPQYIQKHGCKRMRFHDLRHSCASLLLANGVPLKQIQEWLGHSDFSTTANIYAHLDYTSKLSSAKAMVSGMALPESVNFGSKWAEISADDGKN